MRIILTLGIVLWASAAFAQTKTCTSVRDSFGNTTIDCSDLTSATVTPLSKSGNVSTYSVTTTLPPPQVVVPPPQPIPLPALAIQPPPQSRLNPTLMALLAMQSSNRPPSSKQLKKYCKKHPGER